MSTTHIHQDLVHLLHIHSEFPSLPVIVWLMLNTKIGHLLVDLLANTAALHRQAIRMLMSEWKLGWAAAAVCEGSFGCVELFLGRCE